MTIEDSFESNSPVEKSNNFYKKNSILKDQPSFYQSPITINHWQLRDLVHSSTLNENEILYPLNCTIQLFNLDTLKKKTYCEFDYNPRCFNELNGMVASGGVSNSSGPVGTHKGLFSFYNFETNINKTIRIGALINNSVSLYHKSYNQYYSIVCNNDESIYFVDISNRSIQVNHSVNLNSSVNHSSLSPDHKSLIACGDSSNLYFFHPNTTDRPKVIKTKCDSGFSTCFNSSGSQFSVCFQDGNNLIYDTRKTDLPIHEVHSTRKGSQSGAFRCVKYSKNTDDLLIISEHVGRIHLIDTRDFNNHQVIVLPNSIRFENEEAAVPTASSSSSSNSTRTVKESKLNTDPVVYDYNYVVDHYSDIAAQNELHIPEVRPSISAASETAANNYDYWEYSYAGAGLSSAGSSQSYYDSSELEITGIDFISSDSFTSMNGDGNSYLLIGSDKGIIKWKINSWSRRCFPSYEII